MLKRVCIWACAVAIIVGGVASAYGDPVYQTKPVDATTGYVEVYDTNYGVEYGKARIEWAYWQDLTTGFWHYSYQIFNNDYFNTSTDPTDDYHFGWLYGSSPTTFNSINKFSVKLDPDGNGPLLGPSDLAILDSQAGSSAGGGNWGHSPDPGNIGVDWTVSLGTNTPRQIDPARGQWTRVKGKDVWSVTSSGHTSRNDSSGQYFQIASRWAPDWRTAAIAAGVDMQASGLVMAPGIPVPEPSSLIGLLTASGLGALAFLRRRSSS